MTEDYRSRAWAVFWVMLVAGPLFGGAACLVLDLAQHFFQPPAEDPHLSWQGLITGIPFFVMLAYAIGILPALCIGIWCALMTRRKGRFGHADVLVAVIAMSVAAFASSPRLADLTMLVAPLSLVAASSVRAIFFRASEPVTGGA